MTVSCCAGVTASVTGLDLNSSLLPPSQQAATFVRFLGWVSRLFSSVFILLWAGEYWGSACSLCNEDTRIGSWSWFCSDLVQTSRQAAHIPAGLMFLIPIQVTTGRTVFVS